MSHPSAHRALVFGFVLLSGAAASEAQSPPFQASFVGHFQEAGSIYADVWGAGDAAGDLVFLSRYTQSEVDVIDLSNPASPQLFATYQMPFPDEASSAQDVVHGDGLMFVVSEFTGNNGLHIVDVRNPGSPQLLTTLDPNPGSFENLHNCFYDNGWLYMVNSSDTTIAILDLRSYNPDAAPASINAWTYMITVPGALFIHDITVRNGRLFASGWDNLTVYDVSNLGVQGPTLLGSIHGMSNHAVWPTDDGQYFVTADERQGGALRLYELVDLGSSVAIVPRDSYQASVNDAYCVHNTAIVGDRVYSSWYQAGALVHQIDRTSKTLQLVASYDTSAIAVTGFAGAWGVYPLLGADRVLLSDIENGLFVVDMSAVQIAFVTPRPETLAVGTTQPIVVEVTNIGNRVANTGSVTLRARVNDGVWQAIPMLPIGGNRYQADLPQMNCNSSTDWYVTVQDLGGQTWANPATAPAETWAVHSSGAAPVVFFSDDFQTNLGWSVTNSSVSAGAWARANPGGTGGQPQGGDPDQPGSSCYVTGALGGVISTDDLDGGPTTLTSPVLDFSAGDGLIRYTRWFFNDRADGDTLAVQVSNNNGGSWTTVESVARQNGGGWIDRSFRLSDFVAPTGQVRVRFVAADQPNNSVTEAAIDSFRALRFDCASAALALVRTGLGINLNAYTSETLPIIGMDWRTRIQTTAVPGANLTYMLGLSEPFDPGLLLNVGELLVDVTSEPLITNPVPPAGGSAVHVIPIPSNSLFQGLEVFTQGVIFAPGTVKLTNAIDARVDY